MAESVRRELEQAWRWREERGVLTELAAVRIFHGPGEGSGPLRNVAVDRFGAHAWVTQWEGAGAGKFPELEIVAFLKERGFRSAVALLRPEKGVPAEPRALFGEAAPERFETSEAGARFWIQLLGARHPGLFLDHLPLRRWLGARARGLKVLNTFAYTGSLSVAAGLGGAEHVTTLDLAKPVVSWAEDNWKLNGLDSARARFIAGDVFEWLPRLRRDGASYDCVILDPPSFSHGKKGGSFSTSRDLARLHELALQLVAPGGMLVTSINSANVSWAKYETDVQAAARATKTELEILSRIDLPETFPTRLASETDRYLKGWVLRKR